MGRKVIIGVVSIGIVILLFAAYLRLTGTKGIPVSQVSMQDVSLGQLDPNVQRIQDTAIHTVEQTRYTVLDPKTRRIFRIFGFQRLLNPGSNKTNWQVERPYINFFEKQFNCRMDAEEGVFQMDTSGGSPVPQNAQFTGKVVIRLLPGTEQQFSETVILMDDLSYSSERSEFFTNGPVELISEQSRLAGKGLLLSYNPATEQIDYFEIKHLNYLRLKNVVASDLLGQSAPPAQSSTSKSQADSKIAEPNIPKMAAAEQTSVAAANLQNESTTVPLYYECTLNDSVRIVYGDQAIVEGAQQVDIKNILFRNRPAKVKDASEPKESPALSATAAGQSDHNELAMPTVPDVQWADRTASPATSDDNDAKDVVVTCRGKLILRPTGGIQPALAADSLELKTAPELNLTVDEVQNSESFTPSQKAVRFTARGIEYNLTDGSALATGPVAFRFNSSSDVNDVDSIVPVVITAQNKAVFVPDGSRSIRQVIFDGDVVGDATEEKSKAKSVRRLYGDVLTVDLQADPNGKTQMSHVAVTGQKVRLESMQYLEGAKSSHVRLDCRRFDYDGLIQTIVAAGPGEIQLNNKDVPADPNGETKSLDFRGPCVALVNGFDMLTWRRLDNKILVDSSEDSMKLSYMTLKDGSPDTIINAQTMSAEIQAVQDANDRSVLKEVIADKGVFVEQVGIHALKGQKLRYLGEDGWLYIEGDANQPCFVDGVKVPAIQYNLQTGQLKTALSSSPGVGLPNKK